MRKIIAISDITIDGVVQSPGAPEEDTLGGFKYGGWIAPYLDEETTRAMEKQMKPTDILLGRKTFEIFAGYWPKHADNWPGINEVTKYVIGRPLENYEWQNTVFLKDVGEIENLKNTSGTELKIWGSASLVNSLLKHDLIDEIWLKIYPITLGAGKRLFREGINPVAFKLTESIVTSSGVIMVNYKRDGQVKTGTVGL